ncbi:MAG TPA: serine hydrolase domain-containing protein [Gemmatimonadales bacterium]|nr:serine hydrolase domain-containing protein [Gemmatimonadales bacterium]
MLRSVARRLPTAPFLCLLAAWSPPLSAQPDRDGLIRTLDSLAGAPVQEKRAVGIAVAIVKGKDTLLLKGYGKADVEWNIPMPADAMFEIGSVTKQFTAAAILQLRDEGKLSLDDELTKYLPSFPTHGNKIPLRRLLDHTSGIKGITEIPEFRELSIRTLPRDSAIALIARQPFDFPTGEAQIYNNSAFLLLGHVIEKASGMSYEDYVEKKIFAPLGMTRSMYCNSAEVVERRAHGYGYQRDTVRRAPMNVHIWPFSAGSLCSTAGDMVAWLQGLHGGKVLTSASYAEMVSPSKLNDGTPLRYGMGIGVGRDLRGLREIGHGGAIAGFVSHASWYPDAQLAVVVLMNSAGPISPQALASELAGAVLPWTRPVVKPFTGDAAPLVGKYSGPSRGRVMEAEVTKTGEGLSLSVNGAPARPIQWVEGWTFRTGGTELTFRRSGGDGPATELRYITGGGYFILKRKP